MSDKSKILWTDATWQPVVGCSKVSEGCKNCYAERMALRLACMEFKKFGENMTIAQRKYTGVTDLIGKWNGEIFCDESVLDKPLHWRNPRRIFVCSMGDLFHEAVPFEFTLKVFKIINNCKKHTFQILTKRPKRAYDFYRQIYQIDNLSNLWLGVSVENQKRADERIPLLLQIPAAVRFVSIEPMLEEIDLTGFKPWYGTFEENQRDKGLHWVIIGCESINGRLGRECKLEWIESIVDQCKAANIPVLVKQTPLNGKLVRDIKLFPKALQFQEYPK